MSDTFEQARRTRLHELEQSFIGAMKEQRFSDALRFVRTVLEIDPTSTRYNEFIPLLEEKVSNDIEEEDGSSDDDDGDDDDDDVEEGRGDGESEDDIDDDSDEEDDEDDVEAGIEADTAAADTATTGAEEACDVEVADSITLDPKNLRMSKEERNRIRNSLRSSIQDLKEKEVMEKLTASDPLLG